MDFKVNREAVCTNEPLYDNVQEQSVELDYILPDYFPDIFKLLKCTLTPRIISSSVMNDKVNYDLAVNVKVLYCSEKSCAVQCIEQRMNYSKTVDLGKSYDMPMLKLCPKVDYVNCRVVNQRRIDLRGAVSTKVRVNCEQREEVITNAYGMNVQLKREPVEYCSGTIRNSKIFNVSEEFDLGYSKPSIISIIRSDVVIKSADKKVIANKLMVKGEIQLNVLYSCVKDEDDLESMQFVVPYSQIIDMDGLDERYDCVLDINVSGCDVIAKANEDSENKIIECEIIMNVNCTAFKKAAVEFVTDVYSTTYPCSYSDKKIKIPMMPKNISENFMGKSSIGYSDGGIEKVFDSWCIPEKVTARINPENRDMVIMGNLNFSAIAKTDSGIPIILENNSPFEYTVKDEGITANSVFEPDIRVNSTSFNLTSSKDIEIKSDISITGTLYNYSDSRALSDISVNEDEIKKRDGNYALKLYFADSGENVWDIAKKYSTSVDAIMQENDLDDEILSERGMILIPILN